MSCSKELQIFFGQVTQKNTINKSQKHLIMKTVLNIFLIAFLTLTFSACSKDETPKSDSDTGKLIESEGQVKLDEFDAYKGEIGVVLDARPLARKGYNPKQVTINIKANSGDFTQTVPVEEYTFLGQLKIPLEGMSEAAIDELTSGVEITPEYKDESGEIIFKDAPATVSLQANPSVRKANAATLEETTKNKTLTLGKKTTYFIQRMKDDGSPDNGAWRFLDNPSYDNVITANVTDFSLKESDRGFAFDSIPGELNTFAIIHKASGRFVQATRINVTLPNNNGSLVAPNLSQRTDFAEIQNAPDYDSFKFRFDQLEDGSFSIVSIEWGDGFPLQQIPGYGLSFSKWVDNTTNGQRVNAEPRSWRVVSTSINWNVINIGTTFQEPILPKAETAFSFNSTLTNCGQGTFKQTVGVEKSETNTNTVGWEESLSMTTSNTVDVSATVSVGFEANFFGSTASYDMSLTAGYSHSWSSTEESSKWGDRTQEESTKIASSREVTVIPKTSSLVYDVYQFYPKTKVNFAQRMRIEGLDTDTNKPLTGNQIKTLFYINKFNGVITSIEPTSIVITLKGTITLDKVIKAESSVQDIPVECN
jgi:hypothetical protein